MGFLDRLRHTVTIERVAFDDSDELRDDYGQPVRVVSTESARALVQPRSVTEMPSSTHSGAEVGSHVIFMPLVDLDHADAIVHGADRYEIKGVRRFTYGRTPHLEVDAQLVTGTRAGSVGS